MLEFLSLQIKKLQAHGIRLFKVLKQVSSNAYIIDLPHDYGVSSTFNIEDLDIAYKDPAIIPNTPFARPLLELLKMYPLFPLWPNLRMIVLSKVFKPELFKEL